DDLDQHGVDGLVAQLRHGGDDMPLEPEPPRRSGRSPVLSIVVICVGVYMLGFELLADFRYWLQSSEPHDLGNAADLVVGGRMPDGLHETYVEIDGTPDVQHAIRGTSERMHVGYLRIVEGGGSLFAAIRRPKDEPVRDNFEGHFVGRMTRLRGRPGEWLEQYFRDEAIVRTIDAEPSALWEALRKPGGALEITTTDGQTHVAAGERVRLVLHPPDARVQLGVTSFPDPARAEAVIAELGYPWVATGHSDVVHSFMVRIPEAERVAVNAKLNAALELGEDNQDPKLGAIVLPGTVAFSAPAGDYLLRGDEVSLPREGKGGPVLYDDAGDKLAPLADVDGRVVIPTAWIHAVRIDEPVTVDRENGYIIAVGDVPGDHWALAIGWLVIAALVGINIASLVQHVRRRAA
ncbi:MAG: hypothetical protein IAG13_38230, partial [Deltaproteobacteria bacterium]|nr:hypothetical protein [Nannocystaceae bacterium]